MGEVVKDSSSSDDELKPVRRIIKQESPAAEDYDPMKRKHHSAQSNQDIEVDEHLPTKKVKQEVPKAPGEIKEEPNVDVVDDSTSTVENVENAGDLDISPFTVQRYSLYLPISPIYQTYALSGICAEYLSPLILSYYPPFKGVILAYENPQLSNEPQADLLESRPPVLAKALDEYAASYIWLTADFLLFAPQHGHQLKGWVNYQNESFVGLVCWNFFNARISRERLPPSWIWVGHRRRKQQGGQPRDAEDTDAGYYQDEIGRKVEGNLKFRVADIELTADLHREKSLMRIEGTLLDGEDEAKLRKRKANLLGSRVKSE